MTTRRSIKHSRNAQRRRSARFAIGLVALVAAALAIGCTPTDPRGNDASIDGGRLARTVTNGGVGGPR